eukprot:TRINITY_DN4173_c0_g1_i4.p1 TRINITY_DN4173_c0_g1~~TRINITY_DN4173_c0_g1_i4.p1  ORF type:complete len:461 (+),score=84.27 TRINITY_DN4173_c0_g1_i4:1048-2430(+)
MYNAHSSTGSNLPCGELGRQDSNEVQAVLSQVSTDSQKARQEIAQQNIADLDRRVPNFHVSPSGAFMPSIRLPENFQVSGGLMRYHSAPGSFLATLMDEGRNISPHVPGSSPETGLSQILSTDSSVASGTNTGLLQPKHSNQTRKLEPLTRVAGNVTDEFVKHNQLAAIIENGMESSENNYDSSEISMMYQTQRSQSNERLQTNKLKQNSSLYSDLESCSENLPLSATNSLNRQTSSPAAALSQLGSNGHPVAESGYLGVMTNGQPSTSSLVANPGKVNHLSLSRQSSSPANLLAHLPMNIDFAQFVGKPNITTSHTDGDSLARCTSDSATVGSFEQGQSYMSGLSTRLWEEGTMLSGNYEGIQNSSHVSPRKRGRETDDKNKDLQRNAVSMAADHQFGLYKSMSSDLSLEKILEDSVPCRIRAKRGCATHPRSIAERVNLKEDISNHLFFILLKRSSRI